MRLNEFSKIAQLLAKEHKITIKEGSSWAANIKKREVYYRKNDIYNLPEDHILGLLLHETAHIRYTTESPAVKINQELTHITTNVLEDIAIEYIISGDYPNAGEILESTKDEVLDVLIKILPTMENVSDFEKALLYAAIKFEGRGYTAGITKYEKVGTKVSEIMINNKEKIYKRTITKDLLPIAEEIVNLLIKEFGQPTPQELNQMYQTTQTNNATEFSNELESKRKLIDTLKSGKGWEQGANISKRIVYVDKIIDQAITIGKKLRTVLKRNNAMEFGGRFHSGKLLTKRYVRVKAIKDRKPFTRRIIKSNQSYAFAIASDISGSMFNYDEADERDPASYALSSMHMVSEALRYAGIPRSLSIFGIHTITIAPMSRAQITWNTLIDVDAIHKASQNGTNIDTAITACKNELTKIQAERKIMIILTDGQSDLTDMKNAYTEAKKKGIECLGISIGYNSTMNHVFGESNNTNIDINNNGSTELIGKAFIDILEKTIKNSP